MSAVRLTSPPNAKKQTGRMVGKNLAVQPVTPQKSSQYGEIRDRPIGRVDWPVILRAIWPAKPALELSLATGCTQRQAERVLAGSRGLRDDFLVALLRSPCGLAIWRALMAGSRETWWQRIESDCEYAEAERRLADLRRQREAFERRS